eukprot:UN24551
MGNKDFNKVKVEYLRNEIEYYHGLLVNRPIQKSINFKVRDNDSLHFGFGFATYPGYMKMLKRLPKTSYVLNWKEWTKSGETFILFDNLFSTYTKTHWGANSHIGETTYISINFTSRHIIIKFGKSETEYDVKRFPRKQIEKKVKTQIFYPVIICSWCQHFKNEIIHTKKPAVISLELN